ncbi:MAG: pyroglutamyl-peptidase I, partial [Oxalobacteraceae bacterium]
VSQTAGTFVCNQVFYLLQHALAATAVRSGFIHVPFLPEQVVVSGQPSMALDKMVKGLRVAVETAWQTSADLAEAGGQVS